MEFFYDALAVASVAVIVLVIVGAFVLVFWKVLPAASAAHEAFGRKMDADVSSYLATAIVSRPLVPAGTLVEIPFSPMPGKDHGLFLDFGVASETAALDFELLLSLRVGGATLLDRTCAVHCEVESDGGIYVYGLPEQLEPGAAMAAGSIMDASGPGNRIRRTVPRAFRFQAPSTPTDAVIRARVVAKPNVVIDYMTLSVTPTSWPGRS